MACATRASGDDAIYEKIVGVRGAFATRIAYVAVNGQPPAQSSSSSLRTPMARIRA